MMYAGYDAIVGFVLLAIKTGLFRGIEKSHTISSISTSTSILARLFPSPSLRTYVPILSVAAMGCTAPLLHRVGLIIAAASGLHDWDS